MRKGTISEPVKVRHEWVRLMHAAGLTRSQMAEQLGEDPQLVGIALRAQGLKPVKAGHLGRGDVNRQQVLEQYADFSTNHALAEALGLSDARITQLVNELAAQGQLAKRPRSEAARFGADGFWQSEDGKRERQRRSEQLRTRAPVEPADCELCGLEIAHRAPGQRMHDECHAEWSRLRSRTDPDLRRARDTGRERWLKAREKDQAAKRTAGYVTLEEVPARIPRELGRTRAAILGHIAHGGLLAQRDEYGQWWIRASDLPSYVEWLREHPDGRLTRFKRRRFRQRWTLGRKAAALYRAGYSSNEAARELGYSADYVAKLWRRQPITADVRAARLRRRLLAVVSETGSVDFREAYRALHVSASEAAAVVVDPLGQGELKRDEVGGRVALRRVSQIPD